MQEKIALILDIMNNIYLNMKFLIDIVLSHKIILPFDAVKISTTHSQLAGVTASFSLIALIFLLEKTPTSNEKSNSETDRPYKSTNLENGMLLLFLAFLSGLISSYLFSSCTGDNKLRGYFLFHFSSAIIAIHSFTLLTGVGFLLKKDIREDLLFPIFLFILTTMILVIATIYLDLKNEVYTYTNSIYPNFFIVPSVIALSVLFLIFQFYPKFKSIYIFCCFAAAFVITIWSIQICNNTTDGNPENFRIIYPVVCMFVVTFCGGWLCYLLLLDLCKFWPSFKKALAQTFSKNEQSAPDVGIKTKPNSLQIIP